jgi:hypothetical protein
MKFVCNTVVPCSCYLNCLYRLVVAHPFELRQHLRADFSVYSCWTNIKPTTSSFFFAIVGEAGCMRRTPIALMALQICLLNFPLPALLLIYDLDHFFSQWNQILPWWFFFWCQLQYFSMHCTIVFSQAKSS